MVDRPKKPVPTRRLVKRYALLEGCPVEEVEVKTLAAWLDAHEGDRSYVCVARRLAGPVDLLGRERPFFGLLPARAT